MTLALMLAMFFGENRRGARNPAISSSAGVFVVVPFLLIVKQPDLGTAVTLLPVFFGVAYLAGLRLRLLAVAAVAAVLLAPIAWNFALKDYQKSRIIDLHRPGAGPAGRRLSARFRRGSPSDPAA